MQQFQYNLQMLLGAMGFVAVCCAVVQTPSVRLVAAVAGLTATGFAASVLLAVFSEGRRRGFWMGFALAAAVCYAAVSSMEHPVSFSAGLPLYVGVEPQLFVLAGELGIPAYEHGNAPRLCFIRAGRILSVWPMGLAGGFYGYCLVGWRNNHIRDR